MAVKRKKSQEVRVRLTDELHARLQSMAIRRGIPMASLATFYVTKALDLDEASIPPHERMEGVDLSWTGKQTAPQKDQGGQQEAAK